MDAVAGVVAYMPREVPAPTCMCLCTSAAPSCTRSYTAQRRHICQRLPAPTCTLVRAGAVRHRTALQAALACPACMFLTWRSDAM